MQTAIAKSMNNTFGATLAAATSYIKTNRLMPNITTKIPKEREKKIAPGRLCEYFSIGSVLLNISSYPIVVIDILYLRETIDKITSINHSKDSLTYNYQYIDKLF